MPDAGAYELCQESHGLLLSALLPVAVETSPVDRSMVRLADAMDRRLAGRRPGAYQWIAGRRRC